jgi:acyl dehydratase
MSESPSFEALQVGQSIPELERTVGAEQIVRYAGASGDYSRPHWDYRYMRELGFPDVIVHGWMTFGIMCDTVASWLSVERVHFLEYRVRYHRPHLPGIVRCGGKVVSKGEGDEGRLVHLDVWAKDAAGAVTSTSHMTVRFM